MAIAEGGDGGGEGEEGSGQGSQRDEGGFIGLFERISPRSVAQAARIVGG